MRSINYFDDIFKKGNIQSLCNFVLSDYTGDENVIKGNYKDRIESKENPAFEMIIEHFPDMIEQTKLHDYLFQAIDINKEIYLEIGLKLGARFATQLLSENY